MTSSWALVGLVLATLNFNYVLGDNNSCSDSWLYIDIHYRVTEGKNDSFSYGLFIGAGTSSQNQSLWLSVENNETYLASHEYCTQNSPSDCKNPAFTHGHFGSDFSSTWNSTPSYTSLDFEQRDSIANLTYGRDNLNLFTHYFDPSPPSKYVVHDIPIATLSDAATYEDVFFHSGSVGLGPSSTLIKRLVDDTRIDRNVVGMYLGTAYPRAGGVQNGSIVLGGYDSGRIEGQAHKYLQDPSPPRGASSLKLHVKQMSLVTDDGSSIALITDDGFDAHISTTQYNMDLPQSITSKIATALNADNTKGSEGALQLAQKFNGNLTVTLDDGFQITYPSEWISNVSNLTPFSTNTATSNSTSSFSPLVFGTAFLHHLYLTIDYEAAAFYLSDVKMDNNYVQPQSLCIGTVPQAQGLPSLSKFAQTGMIGAIIGGLIAGLGAAWLLFFCVRYRLRKLASAKQHDMENGEAKPKKSSLRKISKLSFLNRKRTKKEVVFGDVKRVSRTSSETSGSMDVRIDSKTGKGKAFSVKEIELDDLQNKPKLAVTKRSGESPVSPLTPPPPKITVNNCAGERLPTPDRFSNPYAPPNMPDTPYTVATPGTGNPLLQSFHRQYSNYDDKDDSDLPPRSQISDLRQKLGGHSRTASDVMRDKLGLTVSTGSGSLPLRQVNQSQPEVMKPRTKPAPLPLKVMHMPPPSAEEAAQNMSPISMRSTHSKRHSLLRKVFPAS